MDRERRMTSTKLSFAISILLAVVVAAPTARAGGDPKVNAAFIQAKNAEHNFECCYTRALAEYETKAKKCVAAIDSALAAGAKPDDQVGSTKKTLAEARDFCASGFRRVSEKYVAGRLAYFETWVENIKKQGDQRTAARVALDDAKKCRAEVDAALAAGVPADAPIKLKAETIQLGAAKAKVCDAVAGSGQGVIDTENAKLEAKQAPYRKALTGDKLNLILNLWGDSFYGVGGAPLDTPDKLAAASAWFGLLTWEGEDGKTHWTVRKYAFKGDKAIGNATERSGCCDSPPSGAYR
jgi:hypothetical protein